MNMLLAAMRQAKSTDAKKVAFALEGMSYKSPIGEIQMRKTDHQLQAPLLPRHLGQAGHQGRQVRRREHRLRLPLRSGLGSYVSSQPTSCQMKRPGA